MSSDYTSQTFMDALMPHIRSEMEKLVAEEAERAAERVSQRAKEMAPRLVMQLLSQFDVSMNRQEIMIRVRQDDPTHRSKGE